MLYLYEYVAIFPIKPSKHPFYDMFASTSSTCPQQGWKHEKTTSITQANRFIFYGNSIPASCWLCSKNYKNPIFSTVRKARAQASSCLFDHSTYSTLFPVVALLFMFQTLVPVIMLYTCSVPAKRIYSKLEGNWFANGRLVN